MKGKTWLAVIVGSIIIAAFSFGLTEIFADKDYKSPLPTEEITNILTERYPGDVEQVELKYDDGEMVYVGKLVNSHGTYEIKLDAITGIVLEAKSLETSEPIKTENVAKIEEQKSLANDNGQKIVREEPTKPIKLSTKTTAKANENKENGIKTNEKAKNKRTNLITMEEAVQIALAKFPGTLKEVELDDDDGRSYFEIEIYTANGEVEVEIDARTREFISIEFDD